MIAAWGVIGGVALYTIAHIANHVHDHHRRVKMDPMRQALRTLGRINR